MRRQTGPAGVTGSTARKWVERRDWGGGCARPVGLVPEGVGIACVDVGVDGQRVLVVEEEHENLRPQAAVGLRIPENIELKVGNN